MLSPSCPGLVLRAQWLFVLFSFHSLLWYLFLFLVFPISCSPFRRLSNPPPSNRFENNVRVIGLFRGFRRSDSSDDFAYCAMNSDIRSAPPPDAHPAGDIGNHVLPEVIIIVSGVLVLLAVIVRLIARQMMQKLGIADLLLVISLVRRPVTKRCWRRPKHD